MKLTKIFGKRQSNMLNILLILGVVVLIGVLLNYNTSKSGGLDSMTGKNVFSNVGLVEEKVAEPVNENKPVQETSGVSPVMTTDGNQFLPVQGLKSGNGPSNNCNNQQMMDPKDLLPKDNNNEWSSIMPNNDLKNVHMLNAGHHIGINSVGSSLRNANLQIRSEPIIPQSNVGPWNNTTIEPDNLRRPLELGSTE
tara:strand:- start:421 stop:1005 length:585 start_codon:yes stop_codon:yes gene_type:complete